MYVDLSRLKFHLMFNVHNCKEEELGFTIKEVIKLNSSMKIPFKGSPLLRFRYLSSVLISNFSLTRIMSTFRLPLSCFLFSARKFLFHSWLFFWKDSIRSPRVSFSFVIVWPISTILVESRKGEVKHYQREIWCVLNWKLTDSTRLQSEIFLYLIKYNSLSHNCCFIQIP